MSKNSKSRSATARTSIETDPVAGFPPTTFVSNPTAASRRVHFLGICGTAMGAVAAGMKEQGWIVTGSDNQAYPPMSDFLASRGI